MKKLLLLLLLAFTTFANSQVVNDECSNATVVQVNSDTSCALTTSGTVQGATASAELNTCSGADDDDVWYQFTATSTSHKISLTNITGSTTNLNHVLYEGTDCGTLIQKYCSDPNTSIAGGLTIGQTYKIRVYSASQAAQTTSFSVCVSTPASTPVNDNCENALPITVNSSNSCASTVTGTLHLATVSPQPLACSAYAIAEDVWYEFVATTGSVKIDITNTGPIDPVNFTIYSGNCGALVSKKCGSTSGTVNNLTIGQTYKLRIYSWAGAAEAVSSFTICIKNAAPVNDECNNATALQVNPGISLTPSVPGTFVNSMGETSNSPDVWYEFTATSTTHAIYIKDIIGTGSFIQTVFSGTCGTLVEKYNKSGTSSNSNSFVIGETYKIRVRGSGTGAQTTTFSICVTAPALPPANDTCASPTIVPVNPDSNCVSSVEGTVLYAMASNEFFACSGFPDDDVWFQFTATGNKHTITLSDIHGSTTDLNYALYEGTACSSSVMPYTGCNSDNEGTHTLVSGQTYKIRVYTSTATTGQTSVFKLCITTPPPPPAPPVNDSCENATVLVVNPALDCTEVTQGTLFGATASTQSNSCYSSTSVKDVWFQFTASSSSHVISFTTPNFQAVAYGLFAGNCSNPIQQFCNNNSSSRIATGLIPGEIYKIRVYANTTETNIQFSICITTPPPAPLNDNCSAATLLTVNSYNNSCAQFASGTLYWSTVSPEIPISTPDNPPCFSNKKDVWFEFVATAPSLKIGIFDIEGNNAIGCEIQAGSNCGALTQVTCTSLSDSHTITGLTIGQLYKIRVVHTGTGEPATTFKICVNELPPPPANDECTNAIPLIVNPGIENTITTSATLTSATISSNPVTCGSSAYHDVWFTFTATSASHILSVSGDIILLRKALYSGSCGNLTQLVCNTLSQEYINFSNLTPGQTYILRISTFLSPGETSNIILGILTPPAPPINDECNNATLLTVNNSVQCTNAVTAVSTSATPSTSLVPNNVNDVWFKFVATNPIHYLSITNTTGIAIGNRILYSGNCGTLTQVADLPAAPTNFISGLTVGNTYYIRVLAVYDNAMLVQSGTFDICISTPPIQPNDNCANAISLPVNPDLSCNTITQGSLTGATPSAEPNTCGGSADDDIWYSFTATSSSHLINIQSESIFGFRSTIYSGSDCSNKTLLTCTPGHTTQFIPGQLYYIRVYTAQTVTTPVDFSICIGTPVPPANDECANASVLTVNNDYSCTIQATGNLQNATHSSQISQCSPNSVNVKDVWFEFVATNSMLEINTSYNGVADNPNVVIYSGECSALTQIVCGSNPTTYVTGLIVGNTYKLRVQDTHNTNQTLTFNICIKTPPAPANDNCANATAVPVNEGTVCEQSTSGTLFASTVSPELNSCIEALGGDVWFQFTATSTKQILKFTSSNMISASVYDGEGCNTYQIACDWFGSTFSKTVTGLTVGNVYKVRVFTVSAHTAPINFDICITTPVVCTEAIPFISGYDSYVFESAVNVPSGGNMACLITTPNPQFFSIEIDSPGDLLFEISGNTSFDSYGNPTGTARDVDYAIWGPFLSLDSACDNLTNSNVVDCSYSQAAVENMLIPAGQTGEYYMVMITNYNGGPGYTKFHQIGGTGTIEVEAPTGDPVQEFAAGVTLGDLVVEGENILWYDTPGSSAGRTDTITNNDTPLPLSTPVISGVTYYASQTKYGIESIMRLAVTVYLTTDTPEINEVNDLFICSDNAFTLVNLTTVTPEILGDLDPADYTVTFHHNEDDAENGMAAIDNPESYMTTIPESEPVFVRVTETTNFGNFAVTNFNVIVEHFEVSEPSVYAICEASADGFTTFNLLTKTQEITAGCTGCTVAYYAGTGGTNPITNPDNYVNTVNPQTIHVAVTSVNGCIASTTLTLEVLEAPAVTSLPVIYTCETDYDLTVNEELYNNNYVISYHTNENDAHNDSNAIINTTAYTGSGSVWVRVENPVTSCYTLAEQQLLLNDDMTASILTDGQTVTIIMSGNGDYQYRLDGGEYQETNSFTEVSYGTHMVSILDGCGNILNMQFTVVPDAPTGETTQTFIQGETLANLDVNGINIIWYGSSDGSEPLTPDTPLVDGITYYASQTINGVESTERLGVTANLSLGIHNNAFAGFTLYPNPVQDIVTISNNNDIEEITVYSILGQQLHKALPKTNNVQIDMSHYMAGVYIITIKSAGEEKTVKLQKK